MIIDFDCWPMLQLDPTWFSRIGAIPVVSVSFLTRALRLEPQFDRYSCNDFCD
ncbi:hypothetical protein RGR602_PB00355 (plasmid) [Rhizobium gallicum bv. gallicum R602sp]|uniref:Uncharacterized protein n=1 Tax=Rhizobium gallicum bv. gallicum R602sp TaxID=1041138 RepID=A0A0B4XBG7_9HYPH|nr:hypothetical protein RGR602_PB00355 [Rhizobium gallicum bv. gallicum R602sp]